MKVSISENACQFLQKTIELHQGKTPTICVFKGGCAGTMLGIRFLENIEGTKVESSGVDLNVSKEVLDITDDISIDVKNSILPEIIVKNNKAQEKCKCGKSFKL